MNTDRFCEQIDYSILSGIALMRTNALSIKDRMSILRLCRCVLEKNIKAMTQLQIPTQLPVLVLVSLYVHDQLRACLYQKGTDFKESLILSAQKTLDAANLKPAELANTHFGICVLFNPQPIPNDSLSSIEKNILLGIHGISITHKKHFALFKNSVAIDQGFSLDALLQALCQKANLPKSAVFHGETQLLRYQVIEFREDYLSKSHPTGLFDLFRANPIFLQRELNQKNLLRAIQLSFSCLCQFFPLKTPSKKSDTLDLSDFFYQYDLKTKAWLKEKSPEAQLRQLASLWILIELSQFLNKKTILKKIQGILSNILENTIIENKTQAYFINQKNVNIGTQGFFLCAIFAMKSNLRKSQKNKIHKMKQFIYDAFSNQHKNLKTLFDLNLNSIIKNFPHESEFHLSFIALLGLFEAEQNNNLGKMINFIEKTFSYYKNLSKSDEHKIKMSNWATQVYSRIYLKTGKIKYAKLVFSMNDLLLKTQLTNCMHEPDLMGSFSRWGNARASACTLESLLYAYQVAERAQDQKRKTKYKTAIFMGVRFILQSQLTPEYCPNFNAIGGFKNHFFDPKIQIDNLQHCGHALLLFYQIFSHELQ